MAARILLVDDNLDTVTVLARMLARHDCEPRYTTDPCEALWIAQDFLPDAVCVDLGMPVMDGYTLAQSIRQVPTLKLCKIIAVSGYPPDQVRLAKAGIDRHMLKPVTGRLLAKVVSEPAA